MNPLSRVRILHDIAELLFQWSGEKRIWQIAQILLQQGGNVSGLHRYRLAFVKIDDIAST